MFLNPGLPFSSLFCAQNNQNCGIGYTECYRFKEGDGTTEPIIG